MNIENKVRELLKEKLLVRVTRRVRGPFVVTRPDGFQTEHRTKREALQRMYAELRCMKPLTWELTVLLKKVDE